MRKICENPRCGRTYEAKTARSRFHSDVCRVQASRLPAEAEAGATVTKLEPRSGRKRSAPKASSSRSAEVESDQPPTLAEMTRAELLAAGRDATALGVAALLLAKRADRAVLDTGSSTAALTKEWQRMLSLALDGAVGEESQLKQLRKVRLEQVRPSASA